MYPNTQADCMQYGFFLIFSAKIRMMVLLEGDDMNKKWMGSLLLLLTAMLWGFCFVVQRSGMEYVGPFTFGASRFLLGALALLPLALRPMEAGKRKKSFLAGLPCGVLLFLGARCKQLGLQTTSAGKAGFLTALYIVLVPLLGLLAKQRVRATVWTAAQCWELQGLICCVRAVRPGLLRAICC